MKNAARFLVPSVAVLGLALLQCGSDDTTTPVGAAGAAGFISAGGSAGSPGTGGYVVTGGAAGSTGGYVGFGGYAGGVAGASGTGGAAGGFAGAGGVAGFPGTGGTAGTGGGPGTGGRAGRDGGGNTGGFSFDAGNCPATAPTDGDQCTGGTYCPYTNEICTCQNRQWNCYSFNLDGGIPGYDGNVPRYDGGIPGLDGGNMSGCPATQPNDGSNCTPTGGILACNYSGTACVCFGRGGAQATWNCY